MEGSGVATTPGYAPILGGVFGVIGLAALAAAMSSSHWRMLGIAIALVSFFAAASVLSNASRIARQLPALVGTSVRIEVWGKPIDPTATLRVHSVRALGAGLHIYVISQAEKLPRDLKIAQPSGAQLGDTEFAINGARYVSLAGTKLERSGNHPALLVSWPAA
jgi:hypothetical protein